MDHEPAFKWWVKTVLKKRLRIISLIKKIKAQYFKKTHKFGIIFPKPVAQSYALDKKNVKTLWPDNISKEMKDMSPAFKKLENGKIVPIGYQRVNCHIIFDVKMEDSRRKAGLVAGGHVKEPPDTLTYSSLVSREIVSISLTLAALNGLHVKVADIHNAYIKVPITENIWKVLGQKFGKDAGIKVIVVFPFMV